MITADSVGTNTCGHGLTVDTTAFYNALWNASELSLYVLEVLETGADFRFVTFNQAYIERSPVSVAQLKGRRLSEHFSTNTSDKYRHYYQICARSGEAVSFEESQTADAQTIYWRRTIHPLVMSGNEVSQLLISSVDITAEKRESLLSSERKILQTVIDTVPAAIFWKDRESRYLGCNRIFADIAGVEKTKDLVGKNDYDMVWKKEESDWFVECDQRVMNQDQPELDILEPQMQSGGRQAWLKTSKIPLHDDQNNVVGIFGIIEDLTERKETEAHKDRLLTILEATPDVISITDPYGNCQYLNKAGQQMFDTSLDQVSHLNLRTLSHSATGATPVAEAFQAAEKFGLWSGESIIESSHGVTIPVSHVIICHKVEGVVQHFSSIMRDISDRKANETILTQQSVELTQALQELQRTQAQIIQSEKMSSLGQMVAGVAHEINNPVNFIHGNLEPASVYTQELLALIDLYQKNHPDTSEEIENALEDIDVDFVREDLPKLLKSMSLGTERIREIVLSLRNFSRLDESDVKTVDIHEGIDSTLVILNHRLKSDNESHAIRVVKQYGELPLVDCYPSQLNQVLMNILANAIEALEEQSDPEIVIVTEINQDFVNIRIKDNGPGIPQEIQPQILDPFFTTKPIGKGTGMGMSISYQIITEKHGGQLKFASEVGQGTEFCITIPIHQPEAS